MIAVVADFIGDLVLVCLGFLKTDDIGLDLIDPFEKALLENGTYTVHIPRDDLHRPALSSDIVNNDANSYPASSSLPRPPCSRSITHTT